jgi:hypothetical protein
MPMPRRRMDELGTGIGPASIPYSRAPEEDPFMGMLDPNREQDALAFLQKNQGGGQEDVQAPPDQGMTPPPPEAAAPTSDQLSDQDLATMTAPQDTGQDPQIAQVIAALEDPNTPPETRQRVETMLALAARRRMAGLTQA